MPDSRHDDDPDLLPCYRHPGELTALQCISCERPICVDCVVQAPVGIKCPGCARVSRAARGVVPVQRIVIGLGAGLAIAVVLGSMLAVMRLPLVEFIAAWAIGALTGTVVRRASGGFRDPALARGAAVVAAAGLLALPLSAVLGGQLAVSSPALVYSGIGALLAAWGAYTRAS